MDVHTPASCRGLDRRIRACLHPAEGGFGLAFGVDSVGKVNRFIRGQAARQALVKRDDVSLPFRRCDLRQGLRFAILKAQPGQQPDAARMRIAQAEFSRDMRPDPGRGPAEPRLRPWA